MRLVEKALDGSPIAWASLMLTSMYEKIRRYAGGTRYFYFGTVLISLFFEHVPSS